MTGINGSAAAHSNDNSHHNGNGHDYDHHNGNGNRFFLPSIQPKPKPVRPKQQARKESIRAGKRVAMALSKMSDESRARAIRFLGVFCDAASDISPVALYRSEKVFGQMVASYAAIPETLRGFWALGSARFPIASPDYEACRGLSRTIVAGTYARYPAVTGGGPGAMEAAAHGSVDAGGEAVAFCLKLKKEEAPNPYSRWKYTFTNFGPRKFRLLGASLAAFALPGGFGTLDEDYEIVCMIQNLATDPMPHYLIGRNFWYEQIRAAVAPALKKRTISIEDLDLVPIVDVHRMTIPEAEQRQRIFPDEEIVPGGTENQPCLTVVGRMDWLRHITGYLNNLDPEYKPTSDQLAAAKAAMSQAELIPIPADW
jgi:predicted Rossmann-fold nucleotide-binding protein